MNDMLHPMKLRLKVSARGYTFGKEIGAADFPELNLHTSTLWITIDIPVPTNVGRSTESIPGPTMNTIIRFNNSALSIFATLLGSVKSTAADETFILYVGSS